VVVGSRSVSSSSRWEVTGYCQLRRGSPRNLPQSPPLMTYPRCVILAALKLVAPLVAPT
jgi:hypothetical protein